MCYIDNSFKKSYKKDLQRSEKMVQHSNHFVVSTGNASADILQNLHGRV